MSTAIAARGASEPSRWRTVDIVVVAILASVVFVQTVAGWLGFS